MKCPTYGADSSDACRYRYDDIGCDHPEEIQEVAEALGIPLTNNRYMTKDEITARKNKIKR